MIKKWDASNAVAIHYNRDLTAVSIRTATPSDPAEMVFKASEMGDLWLTLQGQSLPVRNTNFVMYGKEVDENGAHVRVKPDVTEERNGKVNGYAYTAQQLVAFGVPQNLHLCAGNYGAPLLIVGAAPYVPKGRNRTEKPIITRITAKPAAPAAPTIQRRVRSQG